MIQQSKIKCRAKLVFLIQMSFSCLVFMHKVQYHLYDGHNYWHKLTLHWILMYIQNVYNMLY